MPVSVGEPGQQCPGGPGGSRFPDGPQMGQFPSLDLSFPLHKKKRNHLQSISQGLNFSLSLKKIFFKGMGDFIHSLTYSSENFQEA